MIYRKIEGVDGEYFIQPNGNVWKQTRSGKKIVKQTLSKGYYRINVKVGETHTSKAVHRLVAQAYIPNPENKPCVNHKDGVKTNNAASNLEWCTHAENTRHALERRLIKKGCESPSSILTKEQVELIKQCLEKDMSINLVAKSFAVSRSAIDDIKHKKTHISEKRLEVAHADQ